MMLYAKNVEGQIVGVNYSALLAGNDAPGIDGSVHATFGFVPQEFRAHGMLAALIEQHEKAAKQFVRDHIPNAPADPHIITFLEQNDPLLMTPAQYTADTESSGLDQCARRIMFENRGYKTLGMRYIQPPIETGMEPANALALLIKGVDGETVPTAAVESHLRNWFELVFPEGTTLDHPSCAPMKACLSNGGSISLLPPGRFQHMAANINEQAIKRIPKQDAQTPLGELYPAVAAEFYGEHISQFADQLPTASTKATTPASNYQAAGTLSPETDIIPRGGPLDESLGRCIERHQYDELAMSDAALAKALTAKLKGKGIVTPEMVAQWVADEAIPFEDTMDALTAILIDKNPEIAEANKAQEKAHLHGLYQQAQEQTFGALLTQTMQRFDISDADLAKSVQQIFSNDKVTPQDATLYLSGREVPPYEVQDVLEKLLVEENPCIPPREKADKERAFENLYQDLHRNSVHYKNATSLEDPPYLRMLKELTAQVGLTDPQALAETIMEHPRLSCPEMIHGWVDEALIRDIRNNDYLPSHSLVHLITACIIGAASFSGPNQEELLDEEERAIERPLYEAYENAVAARWQTLDDYGRDKWQKRVWATDEQSIWQARKHLLSYFTDGPVPTLEEVVHRDKYEQMAVAADAIESGALKVEGSWENMMAQVETYAPPRHHRRSASNSLIELRKQSLQSTFEDIARRTMMQSIADKTGLDKKLVRTMLFNQEVPEIELGEWKKFTGKTAHYMKEKGVNPERITQFQQDMEALQKQVTSYLDAHAQEEKKLKARMKDNGIGRDERRFFIAERKAAIDQDRDAIWKYKTRLKLFFHGQTPEEVAAKILVPSSEKEGYAANFTLNDYADQALSLSDKPFKTVAVSKYFYQQALKKHTADHKESVLVPENPAVIAQYIGSGKYNDARPSRTDRATRETMKHRFTQYFKDEGVMTSQQIGDFCARLNDYFDAVEAANARAKISVREWAR